MSKTPPYRHTRRPAFVTDERRLRVALNDGEPASAEALRKALLDDVSRRPPGTPPPRSAPAPLAYRPRILFRLADHVTLDADHEGFDTLPPKHDVAAQLAGILDQTPGALAQRALPTDPALLRRYFPEGLRWWAVELPAGTWPEPVLRDLETKGRGFIATEPMIVPGTRAKVERPLVYLEPAPARPPGLEVQFTPAAQRFVSAPAGVSLGLAAARAWPGSDGAGVRFVDLEQGWALCHEDLPRDGAGQPAIRLLGGANYAFAHHGTAVVGIINAITGNDAWGDGLASAAQGFVSSVWVEKPDWRYDSGAGWGVPHTEAAEDLDQASGPNAPLLYSCAHALLAALPATRPGDVLLIETQVTVEAWHPDDVNARILLPVEVCPLTRRTIQTCVDAGRIVIECAGNGDIDLDSVFLDGQGFLFGKDDAWRKDSGALLVGAIEPPDETDPNAPLERARWGMNLGSNHGSRIDVCAWGGDVATIGGQSSEPRGRRTATLNFGGTSAAAAIVAGAAIMLQGAKRAHDGTVLVGDAMRDALKKGREAPGLGFLPDLPAVLTEQVGPPPTQPAPTVDLWLQRFPGDDGVTPWNAAPVDANGDPLPPTEVTVTVGFANGAQQLDAKTTLHNRGAAAASGVTCAAFFGPLDPATPADPQVQLNALTPLRATPLRPSVDPGGRINVGAIGAVTVSPGGRYLLVLAASSVEDPAPDPLRIAAELDSNGDGNVPVGALLDALHASNNISAHVIAGADLV
ncbi:MAG: S8 family serine peptidase [Myxococcales bacterium]|nr:S8 family serine peptidase [Myxococcales bacterium]